MTQALVRLYAILEHGTRRRLFVALIGLVLVSALEMLGLVLILPLMQLYAGSSTSSGMLGQISNHLGNPSDGQLALTLASVVFVAFLLKGLFTLAFRWWILTFLNVQAATTSEQLFERYLHAPYLFHLRRNSADLIRMMGDAVNQTYLNVVNGLLSVVSEGTTITAVALVLLIVRPVPALGAILYFVVVGAIFLRYVKKRAQRAGVDMIEAARSTYQAALQGLGGIKEVQVRGKSRHFLETYANARMSNALATRTSLYLAEAPRYVMEMLFIVGVAVMSAIVFTGGNAQEGAATLGLFVAAGFRMLPSMVRLLASTSKLRVGEKGLELVLDDLSTLSAPAATDETVQPLTLHERIRGVDISFTFPGSDRLVLDEVSFEVPIGTSMAIVGSSGAGKTTLVDILLGLHDPSSGQIMLDDEDLADVKASWQHSIGLVPQDVFLLDDSLRANIAFGETDDEIDPDRLAEAIGRAQLDELVASMPEGMETFVGERGVRLSGGQRQRIGIARALYLRPQLLVLDEATSSLDNETERRITQTIESLRGQLTMIVVAHRLSTVRRCDQLIFMQGGKIETVGTFEEVRGRNATFAGLVELGSLEELEPRDERATEGDPLDVAP